MDEKDIYIDLAERALSVGESASSKSVYEYGGFLAYHAFESTGGALCTSHGVRYPRSHNRKINTFVAQANRLGIGRQVASAAIRLASIRNDCLYPIAQPDGTHVHPKNQLNETNAKKILRTAKGVLRLVLNYI